MADDQEREYRPYRPDPKDCQQGKCIHDIRKEWCAICSPRGEGDEQDH